VYGEVLDVVAHNNLRMRGQAFVSFASADVAKNAMKEVQRFPLYAKPMVWSSSFVTPCVLLNIVVNFLKQISFARTRSDAVVKKLDANHFDQHKAGREEHKSARSFPLL